MDKVIPRIALVLGLAAAIPFVTGCPVGGPKVESPLNGQFRYTCCNIRYEKNEITVRFSNGRKLIYDPKRLSGVSVYNEAERAFIDGVIANMGAATPDWGYLLRLVALELGIVVAMDALGRVAGVFEGLLSDLFAHEMSVTIMQHAARMDLEQFEDPEFYDHMERARRQTVGRIGLLSLLLGTAQSLLTLASLMAAAKSALVTEW